MGAMGGTDLTLYELAGANPDLRFSPHCWKVLMALAHKGLSAKRIPLRFADKDRIAFSGQSLLPVLVDGREAVSDSWRIALHLEDRFPALPSLFGSRSAVLVTRFVNSWSDTVLLPAVARIILVDVYRCLDAEDQGYFRASREKYFGMPLEAVVADQPGRVTELRTVLAPVRHLLKKQAFVGGDAPTYADYCMFGMFMWARGCSSIELLETDDPVATWRDRLLESFDGAARSAPSVQWA
ncbi:MAG: glutathione S-transferase [Gammaproteobacteria bacterium]|nr:glutathione S-transferase [Gammaproteobacteria bacterium]